MSKNIPKTELLYNKSTPIDQLSTEDAINLMIYEQKNASLTVKQASNSIKDAINVIYKHLQLYQNSRLIYVGAGTSGRIGMQDGVELHPTFDWPKERLDYLIAGGNQAIFGSIENAEDDIISAKKIVLEKKINSKDVVIGLAASGNTPFTCKVMEEAKKKML